MLNVLVVGSLTSPWIPSSILSGGSKSICAGSRRVIVASAEVTGISVRTIERKERSDRIRAGLLNGLQRVPGSSVKTSGLAASSASETTGGGRLPLHWQLSSSSLSTSPMPLSPPVSPSVPVVAWVGAGRKIERTRPIDVSRRSMTTPTIGDVNVDPERSQVQALQAPLGNMGKTASKRASTATCTTNQSRPRKAGGRGLATIAAAVEGFSVPGSSSWNPRPDQVWSLSKMSGATCNCTFVKSMGGEMGMSETKAAGLESVPGTASSSSSVAVKDLTSASDNSTANSTRRALLVEFGFAG
ncbi:hypothetical protein BU23DRAFT_570403 [Bimuria novae-zelandiae CBS 107.79]|uniref:Uncharacterized protein n=1 Tax=Bimuria novae-zelandiae CBS 107.79 TaxID=1447943 RepID=A0A6A5V2M8_9PLEO|nr:hypothetical protein BU23DRAFT_570403 [Bimuria novae-zelandiae CBS 107.79]